MNRSKLAIACLLSLLLAAPALGQDAKPRPYRLPGVDLKSRVIWGSECESPDGFGLRFGGQDQKSDDGSGRTEIKIDGQWTPITDELRKANPLQPMHDWARRMRDRQKEMQAIARHHYFEGRSSEKDKEVEAEVRPAFERHQALEGQRPVTPVADLKLDAYQQGQVDAFKKLADRFVAAGARILSQDSLAEAVKAFGECQLAFEQGAELLDAEPGPRALSPIVYESKTKLFVLFGGDHLDFLRNDTWVFDPAKRRWEQRHPKTAPPPRANHKLAAAGDGKVKLTGGYTYSNNTDYCGGPYIDLADGDWTYDVAADAWTSDSGKEGVAPDTRVYRSGPFHPDFFMQGDKPDAAAFAARLKEMPANTWLAVKPPHKPRMNRDWGTAVIDPDRDVMLRWSGGHSAHGGSDVPMFHFATGRWELPFPIEFPLGQTYSNTSYPGGFNLNRRPWVTGHTYKGYDYDPAAKRMVFVGEHSSFFLWDTAVGDWVGRGAKPAGMVYGGCFYDLLCKRTPAGVVCWTKNGQLFRFDGQAGQWNELKIAGDRLPGSSVDSAGLDYDAKRDRILLFPAKYGDKAGYSGQVVAVDMKELKASKLDPGGMAGLASHQLGFMRESCNDAEADLVVCGTNIVLPDGGFLTPAFDCAANKWVTLKLGGPNPAGKSGRNVSMGFMYDAKRKLIWSTDTNSEVHVLRLDVATADRKDL